jgi:WD40 repeat protein
MSYLEESDLKPSNLRELWSVDVDEFVIDLAWSPTGQQLAFATIEGSLFLVDDANSLGRLRELGMHQGGAASVSWRADGAELATAGHDGLVKVWDPRDGRLLRSLAAGADWVAKVVYQPNKTNLASAAGRYLRIWSAEGQMVYESHDHASTIADLGWNPDGSGIAVAAYQGVTLHVPGKQSRPRKYEWKGSRLVLATGEQDSTVHFWYVKSGKDSQMWGFPTKVLELSWHRDGQCLATGGSDTIVLWDCSGRGPEGRKPKMFEGHPARITQLAFQHRGDYLVSGDEEGYVLLWDPRRNTDPVGGEVFESDVSRLAWSGNDDCLAVGQRCGAVSVLRFANANGK